MPTLYELLEVSHDATNDEIAHAYRRLALTCHPDKNPNDETATARLLQSFFELENRDHHNVQFTGLLSSPMPLKPYWIL
jgi:curved DNA-binding protein CbpA